MKLLAQSVYVDDVICGAEGEHEAYSLYSSSKEMLSHGSFNLRKFTTSSPSLQMFTDSQELPKPPQNTKLHANVTEADETYV